MVGVDNCLPTRHISPEKNRNVGRDSLVEEACNSSLRVVLCGNDYITVVQSQICEIDKIQMKSPIDILVVWSLGVVVLKGSNRQTIRVL